MPVYAVYIQKETQFRGATRPFGNTYHYFVGDGVNFDDESIALAVADLERPITSAEAVFTGWSTWGPTDGPEIENVIRGSGSLSGNGGASALPEQYKESCALFSWELERSPATNRRRWLRKFIRVPSTSTGLSAGEMSGENALESDNQDYLETNYGIPVTLIADPGAALCTEDGAQAIGSGVVRPYLRTRQIGR